MAKAFPSSCWETVWLFCEVALTSLDVVLLHAANAAIISAADK
jgi:hypothetical protein